MKLEKEYDTFRRVATVCWQYVQVARQFATPLSVQGKMFHATPAGFVSSPFEP
jgi:hypothetical protein